MASRWSGLPSLLSKPNGRGVAMNDAASLEMTPASAGALAPVPETARRLLLRMFADPHLLEEGERLALVEELRACVQAHPAVADLRVLYGMALCVNLDVQAALQLALLVAIILPAVKIAASVCGRLGIPPILGELFVGVALGPGLVDLLHLRVFTGGEATGALMILAQLGGYLLMFIAGVETDIERMRKASGTAFLVALAGVIVPFVLGAGVGRLFGLPWNTACFLGGALTATSVSISARTLMDAGKMSSPESSVILGAAVIDDVMGLFVLSIGLISDYRALAGHWGLLFVVLVVAVAGKLVGCGLAARVCGMDAVRSLRVGCGMISRGEAGLIVTSMGAASGMFGRPEVALMVAVVLLTTLLTPLALRATFALKSLQDVEEGRAVVSSNERAASDLDIETQSAV